PVLGTPAGPTTLVPGPRTGSVVGADPAAVALDLGPAALGLDPPLLRRLRRLRPPPGALGRHGLADQRAQPLLRQLAVAGLRAGVGRADDHRRAELVPQAGRGDGRARHVPGQLDPGRGPVGVLA